MSLERPANVSCWLWYDKQTHADLALWQQCLYACFYALADREDYATLDVLAIAEKKYDALGGERKSGLTRRQRADLRKCAKTAKV